MMKREILPGLSVYLDLFRFGAASIVVLSHLWEFAFPAHPLPWPGHFAVVIFFVLSGFVISHAARPELGLRGYLHHRTARIYPVVLGASLLTILLSAFGVGAMKYAGTRGTDALDVGLNVTFLAQTWCNVALPYNGPFWSLNYEVWYYILFGIWCYHPSRLLLLCAAVVAGPKILLLMPVWLLGVYLHRRMMVLDRRTAIWIFLVTLIAGLAFFWIDVGARIREIMRAMWPEAMDLTRGSNQFVGDFLLGLIAALNFLAAGSLGMGLMLKCERVIRYLSSFTFSMYVFHMPLAVLIWNGLGVHTALPFFALLLFGVVGMGELTERRTKWYRSLLAPLFAGRPPAVSDEPVVDTLAEPLGEHAGR
jgi:peptidoglycan/LPS O-acetylase OafA/YrhL